MKRLSWIAFALSFFPTVAFGQDAESRQLSAVPFTAVKFQDGFWMPRLKTTREVSLPHNFQWCEQTGRIANFAKAGKLAEGKFKGALFNDSDVFKVLEGASYALAAQPDPALEKTVDEVIAKVVAAQQPDGFLNTYFTLAEPGKRWTNLKDGHELYCAGHLIEAAVVHCRATGKRTLLDAAIRLADCIDRTFGPTKRHEVPGHEELELALVKLHRLTQQQKYLDLAKYFIDLRGDASQRNVWGATYQDQTPVRQQTKAVGHAVRAMYLLAGVADIAAMSKEPALIDTTNRLWRDVVQHKMYVTGGIGARHEGESFGEACELPNESAYCETCASIGMALWAHRLNLLYGDARYADVLERVIYNGVLSGVAMDGKHFFYVNPLASDGKHHRQPFFGCACCPSNVVRFLPSLPGYVYAANRDAILVNLYVASRATIPMDQNMVTLTQETKYPWDGRVELTVAPQKAREFAIGLRIPDWCQGPQLSVNGTPVASLAAEKGYVRLRRMWQAGDVIRLDMPMPVRRIEANPAVRADAGRVAIRRGPIVYCIESVDNGGDMKNVVLARDPKLTVERRDDLLGGVTVVHGLTNDGRTITAIPYYAWDHRAAGEMAVWIQQEGMESGTGVNDPSWRERLYRPYSPGTTASDRGG